MQETPSICFSVLLGVSDFIEQGFGSQFLRKSFEESSRVKVLDWLRFTTEVEVSPWFVCVLKEYTIQIDAFLGLTMEVKHLIGLIMR